MCFKSVKHLPSTTQFQRKTHLITVFFIAHVAKAGWHSGSIDFRTMKVNDGSVCSTLVGLNVHKSGPGLTSFAWIKTPGLVRWF